MRPVIGITTSVMTDTHVLHMNPSYPQSIIAAGGLPLMLPATEDPAVIAHYAAIADGLLLSGGDDVDPSRFGVNQSWFCGDICPLRDSFEFTLCREYLHLRKPIFGICRGIQVLNVALGGSLYQDLQHEFPNSLAHRQKQKPEYPSHPVNIRENSLLYSLLGKNELVVNSLHHQAVKQMGLGLNSVAESPDSVVEAVELNDHPFCIGVQWHPERLWNQPGTTEQKILFDAFVSACKHI